MQTISKLKVNVRISELGGTLKNIVKAYADSGIVEDSTLQALIDELASANINLSIAIEQSKALSELEHYDEKRDHATRQLYYYLQGQIYSPLEATVAAAKVLFAEIKKYGISLVKLSYNEETGQIDSLLGDLAAEDKATAIAAVPGLDNLIAQLIEAQAAFNQAYSDELSQLSEQQNKQSASSMKPGILHLLNDKLIIYLRTQALFQEATYGAFAQKVAIAIAKTNANIKERMGK